MQGAKDACTGIEVTEEKPGRELWGWSCLSLLALAIAGVMALVLALSRTPGAEALSPWPLESLFFQALVIHVIFSVVLWFLTGFVAFLLFLVREQPEESIRSFLRAGRAGRYLVISGFVCLFLPLFMGDAPPSLNNYIPLLDHPLFLCGLTLAGFGFGLPSLSFLCLRDKDRRVFFLADGVAATAGAGAAFSFLMALLVILLAGILLPKGLETESKYEFLFWGGGHLLQITNSLLFCGVAWLLFDGVSGGGNNVQVGKVARFSTLALGLVTLSAPFLYFTSDFPGQQHYLAFTTLYRLGVAPPLALFLLCLFFRLRGVLFGDLSSSGNPAIASLRRRVLLLAFLLFGLGGLAGYGIELGDTRTTAHYHAVIGGVNIVLMLFFTTLVLPALQCAIPGGRLLAFALYAYGGGQMIQCLGLFAAGAFGVARKTAGEAQGLDSVIKIMSMGSAGLGALLAVTGGACFVIMTLRKLYGGRDLPTRFH